MDAILAEFILVYGLPVMMLIVAWQMLHLGTFPSAKKNNIRMLAVGIALLSLITGLICWKYALVLAMNHPGGFSFLVFTLALLVFSPSLFMYFLTNKKQWVSLTLVSVLAAALVLSGLMLLAGT